MKESKNVEILRTPESSILTAVAYDHVEKYLYVQFIKGGTFLYSEVPEKVFSDIKSIHESGKSVGSYYTKQIKGKFLGKKC